MDVEGDWPSRREDLNQNRCARAEAFDKTGTHHLLREGFNHTLERDRAQTDDIHSAEALWRAIGVAVPSESARTDPVLGPPVVRPAGNAAKGADKGPSLIEAIEGMVGKQQRPLDGIAEQVLLDHSLPPKDN
jgi:hypothetical protein